MIAEVNELRKMPLADILNLSADGMAAFWVKIGRMRQIEVPSDYNALQGVVNTYTCDGQFGPHAVMRAVMCVTGWKGMQDNFPVNTAHAFCDYMGSSRCLGFEHDTFVVEVFDCNWQLFLVRPCADGRFDVRWVRQQD